MDVNEEIVREYFELVEGCIVRANVQYGSSYHSAIDLLAINKEGEIKDIEVKWRSNKGKVITDDSNRQDGFQHFVKQLKNNDRDKRIKELCSKKPTQKIIVVTKKFLRNSDEWKNKFEKEGINVLFFDDLIPRLVEEIKIKGRYDSPILQTIRMLKYFKMIKEEEINPALD